MRTIELKSCPHCGEKPISIEKYSDVSFEIYCSTDACGDLHLHADSYEEAAIVWNNRTDINLEATLVQEIEDELEIDQDSYSENPYLFNREWVDNILMWVVFSAIIVGLIKEGIWVYQFIKWLV